MAIVVYRCDVCKRELELQRNVHGLERVHRCTITQGCRGKLYQVKLLPDYIRGEIPDDVSGLDNWVPRKVLHNHTQTVERSEWTIVHNMGTFPIVSVFGNRPTTDDPNNREEIIPEDIIIIDDNTLKLRFDRPWGGIAQLVGRQSDPDILRPFERATEVVVAPTRLSVNGELTIATRISTTGEEPVVNLNVKYNTTTGTSPTITYEADDQPSIDSAWIDYDRVIIKGKIYIIRSFNGRVSEMTTGIINSGATFQFTGIDQNNTLSFRDIAVGEVMILLATDPYQPVDKQLTAFIDVTSVTSTKNPFSFYYDSGEFFAEASVIQSVYPPIRSI